MTHLIIFLFFGALCVAGSVNLLVQRHPINSALSLVVVMGALAAGDSPPAGALAAGVPELQAANTSPAMTSNAPARGTLGVDRRLTSLTPLLG